MKEGSEGDTLPLALSKKDVGNNSAANQTSSSGLVVVPPTLSSPPPSYLTSPMSAAARAQVVGATLAAIGAEVAAAAAAAAAAAGVHVGVDPQADNNGGGKLGRVPKDTTGQGPRDKIFVCSVCNRCFGYKHVLQNHERTHTGEKPFECKECHKRFTRDHHLKTHMRLHTGEKPYHCTHCERQFVQVANLRRHLRVHTGERPYACELCTSRFSDSNQLKAHMLIHKGEKPFECKQCLGRFRRRHHLMHHKCPKDEGNIGKPRRGRRPKTAEDLQRETEQLPTVVPENRQPKRERKPRETRRIIKVSMAPIMTSLGEGSRFHHAGHPYSARPPPPLSPPEQTEPEDLSMHSSDNGDRQIGRSHQQPPRPSSVPLSIGAGVHQSLPLRPSRAKTPPGRDIRNLDCDMLRNRMVFGGGGGVVTGSDDLEGNNDGSESEAIVEEEEEDDDDDEDDDDVIGGIQQHQGSDRLLEHGRRKIRLRDRTCDLMEDGDLLGGEDADMLDDDEEMSPSEGGMLEGDDEDSEADDDHEDGDDRRIGRMLLQHHHHHHIDVPVGDGNGGGSETENGGTVSPHSALMKANNKAAVVVRPPHLTQTHPHHPAVHQLTPQQIHHLTAVSPHPLSVITIDSAAAARVMNAGGTAATAATAVRSIPYHMPHNNIKGLIDDENGDGEHS